MARKGSNKTKCQAYRNYNIRNKNKKRKLNKHLTKFPNDNNSINILKKL